MNKAMQMKMVDIGVGARRSIALGITIALLLSSGTAFAGDTADGLFKKGRAALAQGKLADACGFFADSFKLEPAPGTMLNLADCEDKKGDLVKARADFSRVQGFLAAGDDRGAIVAARIKTLSDRIPMLTLKVPDGAAVTLDGAIVPTDTYGAAVPRDPGDHVVLVTYVGHADNEVHVKLAEKDHAVVTLELGASGVSGASASAAPASTSSQASDVAAPSAPSAHPTSRGPNIPAYAGIGGGAVLLGVGAVTGLIALGNASAVHDACPGGVCGSPGAQKVAQGNASQASALGVVSSVAMALGAVGVGAGVYFLTRPLGQEKTAQLVPMVDTKTAGAMLHLTF
jgi:hypothetical protein